MKKLLIFIAFVAVFLCACGQKTYTLEEASSILAEQESQTEKQTTKEQQQSSSYTQQPSSYTQQPSSYTQQSSSYQQQDSHDYVANKNTKKFHKPDCSSVGEMKETNKWYYAGNRQELIDMGYKPCKRCNP